MNSVVNSLSNHCRFFRTDYYRINMHNANISLSLHYIDTVITFIEYIYFEYRIETHRSYIKL